MDKVLGASPRVQEAKPLVRLNIDRGAFRPSPRHATWVLVPAFRRWTAVVKHPWKARKAAARSPCDKADTHLQGCLETVRQGLSLEEDIARNAVVGKDEPVALGRRTLDGAGVSVGRRPWPSSRVRNRQGVRHARQRGLPHKNYPLFKNTATDYDTINTGFRCTETFPAFSRFIAGIPHLFFAGVAGSQCPRRADPMLRRSPTDRENMRYLHHDPRRRCRCSLDFCNKLGLKEIRRYENGRSLHADLPRRLRDEQTVNDKAPLVELTLAGIGRLQGQAQFRPPGL